jgi:hypothetical protein
MPMKAAVEKAPAAGTAVPHNAAAKKPPVHTESAKPNNPAGRKEGQGREEGKHDREGQ